MELKNKTILLTGGSAGIGLEATKQFLKIGAKVIITGRNQEKLDNAKKLYTSLIVIKSDTSIEEDAISLYKQIEQSGLEKNQYTIRLGYTGTLYFLNRLFPKLAFSLVNPKEAEKVLQIK
jgi:short-subunit dehydrogenase